MIVVASPVNQKTSWIITLCLGIAAAVLFVMVGEPERLPWLVVVLSLIFVGYVIRGDKLVKRRPRSKDQAFREACFAFGFTALIMFSIGNFGVPDNRYEPLRGSIATGVAWGVVTYLISRGYKVDGWRLGAVLIGVMVAVTAVLFGVQFVFSGL